MKKSLALALALIMVMGCMGFAAAEGEQDFTAFGGKVTLSKTEGCEETITIDSTNPVATVTLDYGSFTAKDWEEAFYNCGEDNGIYLTARFTLPNGEKKYFKSLYNADAEDDDCLEFLKSVEYMDEGDSFGVGLEIAGVRYDGNNIIITPKSCRESVLIKWQDNEGNDHFH
ncbi:MAG: hypothetical protein PUD57_05260, partial [Clostridiales bacterium]|nr:hypothetical protein [Clostridiales bacterium]